MKVDPNLQALRLRTQGNVNLSFTSLNCIPNWRLFKNPPFPPEAVNKLG